MIAIFDENPPSSNIAARLQAMDARVCEHGRNPCYSRCGVRRPVERRAGAVVCWGTPSSVPSGPWEVIPAEERERWRRGPMVAPFYDGTP